MKWAQALITVPSRAATYLPSTILSLQKAGFYPKVYNDHENLGCFANWYLTLFELWSQHAQDADRFVIFQDDILACKNLRKYLESCEFPTKGYWNLYTIPKSISDTRCYSPGWNIPRKDGKGALALVFSNLGVQKMLTSSRWANHPLKNTGRIAVDGVVYHAMKERGWQEYVHSPSLVQHIGEVSALGNRLRPVAEDFPGEQYDATKFGLSQEQRTTENCTCSQEPVKHCQRQ